MHIMSTAISSGVADGSRDCISFILLEEQKALELLEQLLTSTQRLMQ